RPHVRLRYTRLRERRANSRLPPRSVPGPMLVQVVGVGAVAHNPQASLECERAEASPQLGLAVEAAVGRVGEVGGILELVGVDGAGVERARGGSSTGAAPPPPAPRCCGG